MSLLPVRDAQERVLALAAPLSEETVGLRAAAGRWAARDILALRTQPAADLSAMDGYAVRFDDLPGPLALVGEARAGGALLAGLAAGQAARIFTGAPVPAGADTILIQEDAALAGESVTMTGEGPGATGRHIRPVGSDFARGDLLIRAGERLTPARIALAATGGHGVLPVRRRVRVALVSTGDELVPAGMATPGAALPASNAPMIEALLAGLGADVADVGIIPDRLERLTSTFAGFRGYDLIVTTGGASVGDHDLVRPALAAAGAELDFWKVALKPGKPLMAGRLGEAVVTGLPGNAISAFVTATLFVVPLVRHMLGDRTPLPCPRPAMLAAPLRPTGARAEYLRGTIDGGSVTPLAQQDSAALAALAAADALIVRPPNAPAAVAGDIVEILPLA